LIVYVESNFLLEIAREQEQAADAEQILGLGEAGNISLRVPTFALCEPFSTLTYKQMERQRFVAAAAPLLTDVRRAQPDQSVAENLAAVTKAVVAIGGRETDRLTQAVARMLRCCRVLPLTPETAAEAEQASDAFGLSPQDALVYASVFVDLPTDGSVPRKIFVSRDRQLLGSVTSVLASRGCDSVYSFKDALARIRSVVGSP